MSSTHKSDTKASRCPCQPLVIHNSDCNHLTQNRDMRVASGEVNSSDPLVALLYSLMASYVTSGQVERLMDEVKTDVTAYHFTNGWLAEHAKHIAQRLRSRDTNKWTCQNPVDSDGQCINAVAPTDETFAEVVTDRVSASVAATAQQVKDAARYRTLTDPLQSWCVTCTKVGGQAPVLKYASIAGDGSLMAEFDTLDELTDALDVWSQVPLPTQSEEVANPTCGNEDCRHLVQHHKQGGACVRTGCNCKCYIPF